jgi:hypothetical protein
VIQFFYGKASLLKRLLDMFSGYLEKEIEGDKETLIHWSSSCSYSAESVWYRTGYRWDGVGMYHKLRSIQFESILRYKFSR